MTGRIDPDTRYRALASLELAPPDPAASLDGSLQRIVEVVTNLLPAFGSSIVLYDAASETFHTSATTVPGQEAGTTAARVRSQGATRWIVDNLRPRIVPNVAEDEFGANPMLVEHGLQSYVGTPLLSVDGPLGVLYAINRDPHEYDEEELRFLRIVADRASLVIQSERAHEAAERSLQRAEALYEVSAALGTLDDPTTIVQGTLGGLARILESDATVLFTTDESPILHPGPLAVGPGIESIDERHLAAVADMYRKALQQRTGVHLTGSSEDVTAICQALDTDRVLLLPLHSHGAAHGTVVVAIPTPAPIDDTVARLAATLVAHAGTTIENVSLMHELVRRAGTDPLTGVANRRRFMEQAGREVARSRRRSSPYSVLMVDIDHFKRVNDEHGHGVGDEVLQVVAARMSAALREADLLARYGGEEFIILLPDATPSSATEAAERIRTLFDVVPIQTDAGPLSVTVSVGVALGLEHDLDDVIERSDQALYEAKESGRNRVVTAEAVGSDG